MSKENVFKIATADFHEVPANWMSATQVRPFIFEDPVVAWLQHHGEQHGFEPDTSPYEFLEFIWEKGREFEKKWTEEMLPQAVRVCAEAYEVRYVEKFQETIDLIQKETPVIAQAALWWAPERIYGVPDLLVHSSLLAQKFPDLLNESKTSLGHYVVIDAKFTTRLDSPQKRRDFKNYAAQIRIYSYIVGHLQELMPEQGYLAARDRIFDPLRVVITSTLNQPLDKDLASIRDQFIDIKLELTARGFPNLDALLKTDSDGIPFEECKGLGPAKSKRIRAILEANRSGSPLALSSDIIPSEKQFEFYVDFEYFTNVNVDFSRQWPSLEGTEMIFMVGIGWEKGDSWFFKTFIAEAEDQEHEREMLEKFLGFLQAETAGASTDNSETALYHWTSAEVWQSRRASDRHELPESHPLRILPWCDLQKVFLNSPSAMPGAWGYGLKEVAKALGKFDKAFDTEWPGDLDEGLRAMVMGWQAYKKNNPLQSEEMSNLIPYLEADCKALCNVLKWMRS
ncbi:ribonuclease H-like domain-containing protein [Acidobacteria bacterium AH-259-D05]|nr:ribonuclease H-like domain-containing protein [Acidobacteria bacterium AH-259-D05]